MGTRRPSKRTPKGGGKGGAKRSGLSNRQARHDEAYRRAKAAGYAGRAIYKLEEIDRRFRLLQPGRRVLDLGCWPGSWMQYTASRVGENGFVLGLDLRQTEVELPPWAQAFAADVLEINPACIVERFGTFDVVLSDMAPKTCGDRATDQFRSEELTRRALALARSCLRPGGHFCAKVFVGGGFKALLTDVGRVFSACKAVHPKNTRSGSYEQYVVGRGLRAPREPRPAPPPAAPGP